MTEKLIITITDTLTGFIGGVLGFIPNLIGAIVVFIMGWMIAKSLRFMVAKTIATIGGDLLMEKAGFAEKLNSIKNGLKFSDIMGLIVYWTILAIFMMIVLETLEFTMISDAIRTVFALLPNFVAGVMIVLVGGYFAKVLRDIIVSFSEATNLSYGKILAGILYYVILVFMIITALDQVGIQTDMFKENLNTIITGVVAISVLAIGLGGRDMASNIMATLYFKGQYSIGDKIEFGEVRGSIIGISPVSVSIESEDDGDIIVVPTGKIMSDIIRLRNEETRDR